jgi:hypothetical protein
VKLVYILLNCNKSIGNGSQIQNWKQDSIFSFLSLQQAAEVAVVDLEEAEAEAEERDGKLKSRHLVSHVLQPVSTFIILLISSNGMLKGLHFLEFRIKVRTVLFLQTPKIL